MAIVSKPRPTPPTVADVARAASVSTATVSRVLNAPEVVAVETRERVRDAIEALGYRPNAAARRLAGAVTETLGLILPEVSGPFFSELLAGVEEVARSSGYHLLVAATEPDGAAAPVLPPIDPLFVDGTIVLPDTVDGELVGRLAAHGRPIVLVERSHPDLPSVAFDSATGTEAAVRHLVNHHGARRVACLAGPADSEASRHREDAWARALAGAGLAADPALLVRGSWSEAGGIQLVERLLAEGRSFDALFAVNDETAIGAIRGLERVGLQVPGDVLVCGFDDIPPAGWMRPGLTTVSAPPRTLGRAAAEVLIARIAGETAPAAIRIPTAPVIRSTCGCSQEEEQVR